MTYNSTAAMAAGALLRNCVACKVRIRFAVAAAFVFLLGVLSCDDPAKPDAPPKPDVPPSATAPGLSAWQTRAPMPAPRGGPAAEVISGILYVAGGYNGARGDPSLHAYNPTTNRWVTLAAMPADRRETNGAGVINGELYVAGGWMEPALPTSSLFIYNPANNSWRAAASMPIRSACGSSGVINAKLYVTTTCDGIRSLYRDFLHVYDPLANAWTQRRSPPNVHGRPATGVISEKLYVAGGWDASGIGRATLDVYDPATNSWATRAPMGTARVGAAGAVANGKLYVIGGVTGWDLSTIDGEGATTVEMYDPATNVWTTVDSLPTPRNASGAGVIAGIVHIAGGHTVFGVIGTLQAYQP